jgi:hypothetical protein
MTGTALRRTMRAQWAHVGAMHVELDHRDLRAVGEHLCINDLAPTHGRPVVCCINGEYIGRADWWQPVRRGDVVVFAELAASGDNGRLLATLLVAVASAYTGGAVGAAYGSGWGAASAAAVSVVGGLLVARLFPVGQQGVGGQEVSPTYSGQLEGTRPRYGQAVPVRYGQELFFPDWACPAYTEFAGDSDMYYCTGLAIGIGEYDVLGVYIGDTPIQNFQDASVEIIGPGMAARTQGTGYTGRDEWGDQTLIELGMVTAEEVAGQEILDDDWVGPFVVTQPGWQTDRLFFDLVFPRGVGQVGNDGAVGSLSIGWQVAYQAINDDGQPLAGWVQSGGSYIGATSRPVRISTQVNVAAGRYRVRMRRATPRSENDRVLNDLQWAQARGRLSVDGVTRTDLTGIVVRIRASEQLSAATQRRVKVLAKRLLPVWNGTTWSSVQPTRNPAWALADVWRNSVYGRGLPDSRIDLDSLLDLADVWDERQDRFDYSFDTRMTTDEASRLVAAAGRARTMLRRGAVYSLVRDERQTDAVAVFMPRNMDRDSFALRWALPTSETPDAVAVTYRSGRYWAPRTVYAQLHGGTIYGYDADAAGVPVRPSGVPAPTLIEGVELRGVLGRHHALREAVYLLARALYRRVEGSFTADLDGLLMSMGSLIGIAHDAAQWAQSGDVVAYDSGTLTLTLSEPPRWTTGEVHYVRLQADTGALGGAIEVTPGATDFEVVLDSAPFFTPETVGSDRERTRYLFGALPDVQRHAVAAGLRPTSADTVEVQFFLEDDRVHDADAAWLPVGDEEQDPLADGSLGQVGDDGDGDPDWLPLVALSTNVFFHTPISGLAPPVVELQFGNDGILTVLTGYLPDPVPAQWLVFGAVEPTIAARFELHAELVGAVDTASDPKVVEPTSGNALDTWLGMGTTRRFVLDITGEAPGQTWTCPLRIRIRDVATQTLQAEATLTMSIFIQSPP